MWIKTIATQFKKKKVTVAALVDACGDEATEGQLPYSVLFKTVFGKNPVEEVILFPGLREAEDFVSHFNNEMAVSFLKRQEEKGNLK